MSIDRDLFNHGFFAREPMSEREAWVWLIAHAAWADTRHKIGLVAFDVPRGSLFTSLRELQRAWMWGSDTKVRNFLKSLEKEKMVSLKTNAAGNARKTHVTICNYNAFQGIERAKNAAGNAAETHEKRSKVIREQDNKVEDENIERAGKPAPRKKPHIPMPENWVPSDRNIAAATDRHFSAKEIEDEADKFRNHHLARDSRFADWDRAWLTWIGNARKFAPRVVGGSHSGGSGQGRSLQSVIAERILTGRV